jgi:preprotein translocase subunit YajC
MWLQFMLLAAEDAPQPGGLGGMLPMLLPIMVMAFFLLILMPQRKQRKQQEQLLSAIKRNDTVITGAGIIGVVVDVREKKDDNIKEDELILRVDDNSNTRMRVLKSSIVRVFSAQPASADAK